MTGGSLGLRTGSYGSLQNNAVLPIQTTPIFARKPSKMLLSGSRDKEKFLPWIRKIVGRRRVVLSFLLLFPVAVYLLLMSAITKDVYAPRPSRPVHTIRPNWTMLPGYDLSRVNHREQDIVFPPPVVRAGALPPGHPCKSFAVPPPPADKKRIGPRSCPVCYLPVEQAVALMPTVSSLSPVLKNLTYVSEENPIPTEPYGGSAFGGYPSLKQRNDSFDIKESMNVYCGFVKGNRPGRQTGFDIDDADLFEMEQCHGIVVASAIFGNYDIIQQPKNISEAAKRNICFYMFVDEDTGAYIKNSSTIDSTMKFGLWRVVVVRNLPYTDARRNGKVPKLLLHRIFPNVRFSIWIDGKLELVVDPYQILERFLWRKNANFAISRHYRRFDVFEEAEANKAAGKYENASIDHQVEFYKREGLAPYSSAKLPITSDVPEGCVIIREHIPITNLFTCLWFNEVDRFTSRDQISFSTVRDKIMSKVDWNVYMFMDCERRNFVVQAYHRDLLEYMNMMATAIHPPPALSNEMPRKVSPRTPIKKMPAKRGREKKSGSRRRRLRPGISRETNSF
ncbi:tRNA (met) cytidine acetyltransferase, putative (DUF616) isoform X2 [Tasmannia lanceolata]|uniref:tRNA (met) cytidine acetyltransferase, putative (DUF616) isoform X2 n=1 Tax=Tasmannia lanceolata TaxID=3420 RepID=UPI004063A432